MEPVETIYVKERVVACDGGKLGHPRVFLNLGPKGE
ncbi:MAG: zinc-finger domain-containing protein, partial [Alphaproteobacteria bacterium]